MAIVLDHVDIVPGSGEVVDYLAVLPDELGKAMKDHDRALLFRNIEVLVVYPVTVANGGKRSRTLYGVKIGLNHVLHLVIVVILGDYLKIIPGDVKGKDVGCLSLIVSRGT